MASDTLKYAMYGDCLFIKEAANTASVPPAAEAVSKIRKIRDTAKFVREGIDTINSVKSLISNFLPKPKPSMTDKALDVIKNVSGKAAIPAAILGGYAIKKLIDAVRQHPERRKVYERLVNDPEFKGIDRAKLLEWGG